LTKNGIYNSKLLVVSNWYGFCLLFLYTKNIFILHQIGGEKTIALVRGLGSSSLGLSESILQMKMTAL
jgi:hypothetical protein